ncbi:TetR family transcriptional regulator [Streptomyces gamaensis]|uniref:TetR family transcriptional regulator n=1 Tax=Streptomyces gamaensis TaxID=1763542 RepID=A0ABW0YXY4_9ACTN
MQERSERTRRKLVRAGAVMFDRVGYANATLGHIAREAGLTKGALYFHFDSKEQLAEEIQRNGCAMLHTAARELRAAHDSPLQALVDLTHWLAAVLRTDPPLRAALRVSRELRGTQAESADFHQASVAAAWRLLDEARQSGELREYPEHADFFPGEGEAGLPVGHDVACADGCEGARTLLAVVVCGIEALTDLGLPEDELSRRVAVLWDLMLPGLVPDGTEYRWRTTAPAAEAEPLLSLA